MVHCLRCQKTADGEYLFSGGKDGKVVISDATDLDHEIRVIETPDTYPRAVDCFNGKVLIGLRNGRIMETDL